MRILLIMLQLGIIGMAYLLIAVPLLAATIAIAGLFLSVPLEFLGVSAWLGSAWLIVPRLPQLFPSNPGSIAGAASATSGAGTAFLVIGVPWLAAVLMNLLCGFFAYYRSWRRKARWLAILVNVVVMAYYMVPLTYLAVHSYGDEKDLTAPMAILLAVPVIGYFAVSIALLYFMPARPNVALSAKAFPVAHLCCWAAPALLYALVVALAGPSLGAFFIIGAGAIVLVSLAAFVVNSRAGTKAFRERRAAFAWLVFAANVVALPFCLVLLPPVGVALLLSAALLFFTLEMTVLKKEPLSPNAAVAAPAGAAD